MKNLFLILSLSVLVMTTGCNKTAPTGPDSTTNWVGNYTTGGNNGLTQIQITRVNDKTVKIIFKVIQDYYMYTATTLQNVSISGNNATIAESQSIIESTDLGRYTFQGTVVLNGNHVTLNAIATNVDPTNTENSPMNFSFSGDKVQ